MGLRLGLGLGLTDLRFSHPIYFDVPSLLLFLWIEYIGVRVIDNLTPRREVRELQLKKEGHCQPRECDDYD